MTSELDPRIRHLMQRVVDEAPEPPPDPTIGWLVERSSRPARLWGGTMVLVAALVIILLGFAALVLSSEGGGNRVESSPAGLRSDLVEVTVSGLSGHLGDDLAGVLYAGPVTGLDGDALGGFWSVVSEEVFTTTEVVRTPAPVGVGRFPFVSDEALVVEPGPYTLVVWVDTALNTADRWVPINTDGQGLYGCQAVFEVAGDGVTDVVVPANLQPDGWNVDCTTGAMVPDGEGDIEDG